MELQTNKGQLSNPTQKRFTIKLLVYGILCIAIPAIVCAIILKWSAIWTILQGQLGEFGKGIILGLAILPVMLFIAVQIQNKKRYS